MTGVSTGYPQQFFRPGELRPPEYRTQRPGGPLALGQSLARCNERVQQGAANVAHSNTVSLSNGLVGYWSLDGSQTNWTTGKTSDSSGQGNTGQLISMSTSTSPVAGKIGQALNIVEFEPADEPLLGACQHYLAALIASWSICEISRRQRSNTSRCGIPRAGLRVSRLVIMVVLRWVASNERLSR